LAEIACGLVGLVFSLFRNIKKTTAATITTVAITATIVNRFPFDNVVGGDLVGGAKEGDGDGVGDPKA
jgi:hypothetical protein